jgi:hypothetical protein
VRGILLNWEIKGDHFKLYQVLIFVFFGKRKLNKQKIINISQRDIFCFFFELEGHDILIYIK